MCKNAGEARESHRRDELPFLESLAHRLVAGMPEDAPGIHYQGAHLPG
jgi:hypothetical protein